VCTCQDSKGFLWFGTYDGLNRYDGYHFKVYKNDPDNPYSLSKNNIECIFEDHLGMLWIGTEDGLNYFDRESEKFFRYKNDPNNPNSLSNNYVRYVYEDRSGTLWIGTSGGGLNQFDREKKQFIHYIYDPNNPKSLSQNNALSIFEDSQRRLWIGTDGGLNLFNREKKEFTHYVHDPKNSRSISHNSVWRIYGDRNGILWMGTWGGGLNRFDPQSSTFTSYQNDSKDPTSLSDNVVRAIKEDQKGNLWIGTTSQGLNRFVPNSNGKGRGQFIHYQNNPNDITSLSGNAVLSIFEDRLGILWIGTNFSGISKYNPNQRQFAFYKNHTGVSNSLSKSTVNTIYEDVKGILWIGTNGGGLNRFDRKKNQITHFVHDAKNPRSLSNNMVRSICEDRFNKLWIATDDGLNRYDPNQNSFTIYRPVPTDSNSISHITTFSLYRDRRGYIWAGTIIGLNRFDDKTGKFKRYFHDPNNPNSLSDNFIWTIYEDTSGIFWIGTLIGGLDRFDPKTETFIHYQYNNQNPYGICDNKVMSIYEDYTGIIWFGTSSGLDKFDRHTGLFHRYSESDGLSNNNIQGFDPRTIEFTNYYESYGLQSNEFQANSYCKLRSGEMAFGGVNGFNIFHPDSLKEDTSLPAVLFTDFQIFNKPVQVGEYKDGHTILAQSITDCDEINLSYKENVFSLEFVALHYASPKDNLYAYKMEGFDNGWNYVDASKRFVTYTNLSGGTYTFRVKASNNEGKWNEKGGSIRIIITPPFWRTIWFYGLVLIVIGGIAYWIYRWRVQARDLAAQRRMEAMITKERNLLRTLIDNLPDAVFVKDVESKKIIVNPVELRYLGAKSEAEVLGKTDLDFYLADIAKASIAEDKSIMESGVPIIGREGDYIDNQGNKLYVAQSNIPLRDEHGTIVGLVGVTHDITKQKKGETEREKLITQLQDALADVKLLSGLVPICANCKKIRDDQGYWTQIESYIQDRSDAKFSHSICPDCAAKIYPGYNIKK
jgi:PAS domain S-box-containing protein